MTHRIPRLCLAIVAATVTGSMPAVIAQGRSVTPAGRAAGQVWWAHVKSRADDNIEGRITGPSSFFHRFETE